MSNAIYPNGSSPDEGPAQSTVPPQQSGAPQDYRQSGVPPYPVQFLPVFRAPPALRPSSGVPQPSAAAEGPLPLPQHPLPQDYYAQGQHSWPRIIPDDSYRAPPQSPPLAQPTYQYQPAHPSLPTQPYPQYQSTGPPEQAIQKPPATQQYQQYQYPPQRVHQQPPAAPGDHHIPLPSQSSSDQYAPRHSAEQPQQARVPRTGRGGRCLCKPCRARKRGEPCEIDPLDPHQRCAYCVARNLPCSKRTYGPERERRARELRNSMAGLSGGRPVPKRNNRLGLTKAEVAMGAVSVAATLGDMFPGFPASEIASLTADAADPALFSGALEDLFA